MFCAVFVCACRGQIDFAPVICVAVGASIARPQNLTLPPNSPGGYRIRPYANQNLAPEGSIGEGQKSVKKSAALLRFLAFLALDHPFGVPRGERLAAHNERRQFAAQTRSCGYSPRWGEHCSLPSFAALNRGPLLATPQSPGPGSAASEQRDFFRFLFWSQKRKVLREKPFKARGPPQGGGPRQPHPPLPQNQTLIVIPP